MAGVQLDTEMPSRPIPDKAPLQIGVLCQRA
jgi:hypothetical protein